MILLTNTLESDCSVSLKLESLLKERMIMIVVKGGLVMKELGLVIHTHIPYFELHIHIHMMSALNILCTFCIS